MFRWNLLSQICNSLPQVRGSRWRCGLNCWAAELVSRKLFGLQMEMAPGVGNDWTKLSGENLYLLWVLSSGATENTLDSSSTCPPPNIWGYHLSSQCSSGSKHIQFSQFFAIELCSQTYMSKFSPHYSTQTEISPRTFTPGILLPLSDLQFCILISLCIQFPLMWAICPLFPLIKFLFNSIYLQRNIFVPSCLWFMPLFIEELHHKI